MNRIRTISTAIFTIFKPRRSKDLSLELVRESKKRMAHSFFTQCQDIRELVSRSAEVIAHYWPMPPFAHHNPLHSLESIHFEDAVRVGRRRLVHVVRLRQLLQLAEVGELERLGEAHRQLQILRRNIDL